MCNLLARHLPRNVERSEGQVFLQYDGRIRRRRQSPTSDPALQRFEVVQLCSKTKRHNFIIIIFNIIFSIRLTFTFECWVLRAQMTEKLALLQGFVRQHLGTDHTLWLRFTAADDFRKPEAEECFFICALRHYTATRRERTDSLTQCVHADSAAVISSCSDSVSGYRVVQSANHITAQSANHRQAGLTYGGNHITASRPRPIWEGSAAHVWAAAHRLRTTDLE